MRRRILAVGLVAAVLVVVALPAGVVWWRLHPPRVQLTDDPGRHGIAFEDVAFESALDGTRLRGWYMPAVRPTGRAVVIAHGIDADRLVTGVTLRLAPDLLSGGFDVLAFDSRGSGESGGDGITFGLRESSDVLAAVAEARRRGAERVAVLGFSQGGVAAILAAASSPSIDALVTDSAFAAFDTTLVRQVEDFYRIPAPLSALAVRYVALVAGWDPATIRPVEAIRALAPRPILLIHGDADTTVAPDDARLLAAGAGSSASLWIVPGAGHVKSEEVDPGGYARHVLDFLEAAIPASASGS